MKSAKNLLASTLLVGLALILVGCASPASREGMTPQDAVLLKALGQSVRVSASGGAETGNMDSTNIADADLKAALEAAIEKTGVFKQIVQSGGSEYELSVRITSLKKPMAGFSMTVDLETAWSLVRVSDRKPVLQKGISTTYTAGMSEAFVAVTRIRMAVEGAVRENISQGLRAIADLKA